jgi:hypothetical protein
MIFKTNNIFHNLIKCNTQHFCHEPCLISRSLNYLLYNISFDKYYLNVMFMCCTNWSSVVNLDFFWKQVTSIKAKMSVVFWLTKSEQAQFPPGSVSGFHRCWGWLEVDDSPRSRQSGQLNPGFQPELKKEWLVSPFMIGQNASIKNFIFRRHWR